jgi:hypothetical protein
VSNTLVNDWSNDADGEVWVDKVLEAYCASGPSVAKRVHKYIEEILERYVGAQVQLSSFLPTSKQ